VFVERGNPGGDGSWGEDQTHNQRELKRKKKESTYQYWRKKTDIQTAIKTGKDFKKHVERGRKLQNSGSAHVNKITWWSARVVFWGCEDWGDLRSRRMLGKTAVRSVSVWKEGRNGPPVSVKRERRGGRGLESV